jgi:BASS family bile acid:Na+ symporter
MTIDQLINVLVMILLVEMMLAVGLGVKMAELLEVARNRRLVFQAGLANYLCVPAVTVGLLILFHPADPTVPAGFLILAVCPGAPFGPPCAKIAGGNVAAAVGWMVILAASSAVVAPLLLQSLLPLMSEDETLQVDAVKIVATLLATQLLPLGVGLGLRHWRPGLADILLKPANRLGAVLGLATIGLILVVQFHLLADIGWRGWVGMSALLIASWAFGWLLGGPGAANRKALALTTSLRNVGVGLVIAAANFAGTAAMTAVLAYGIFEIVGSLLLSLAWARWTYLPPQRLSSGPAVAAAWPLAGAPSSGQSSNRTDTRLETPDSCMVMP